MYSYLPPTEKNIVGKVKPDKEVMTSEDWRLAKEKADMAAAGRVIDRVWSDKKTEALRSNLDNPSNIVFITQPSTSKQNVVPVALAKRLSRAFNTDFIVGDHHFDTMHNQQSKHIPQYRRAFDKREYDTVDSNQLKSIIGNRQVILVEDVLTTGGSVADFTHHLHTEGIKVETITALMGDRRLQIDSKTFDKLDQALNNKSIPISTIELSKHITRVEAGGLIMAINGARSDNAREKLTGNLQGLLNKRVVKDLGRNPITRGYKEPEGPDQGNESIAERVQTWPVRGRSGLIPYKSQKDSFVNALERNQQKQDQKKEKTISKGMGKGIEF